MAMVAEGGLEIDIHIKIDILMYILMNMYISKGFDVYIHMAVAEKGGSPSWEIG